MVSKRQLKQVYPLTERAHIMVSTMIWVGLINPPFEVPLGQKGVPLSVSLDHRFTSLGAATAFILWKKEEKQRWEDQAAPESPCTRWRTWQSEDGDGGHQRHVYATWLCKVMGTWAVEHCVQLLLSCRARLDASKSDMRGHPRRYPASCTLGCQRCSCCSNYVRSPSSFRNSSAF